MTNSNDFSPVVLQVLPELEMGGVERGTVEIATYLQKKGIKNFVASQGGRLVYELERNKIPHLTLPLKTKNIFKIEVIRNFMNNKLVFIIKNTLVIKSI